MASSPSAASQLAVHYVDGPAASALLAQPSYILGVIGYGVSRPDGFDQAVPYVRAPLKPVTGGPRFEIWTSSSPCQGYQAGPVYGASSADWAFGTVEINESGSPSLEAAVEKAYGHVFEALAASDLRAPVRFWNYLTMITGDESGMERYRRFNIGRHRAFEKRLRQALPPAASCVGGHDDASVVYFLASRAAARPVENPRQVTAYDYPPVYGPRSPSFSRAGVHRQGEAETLFISGTASIVGHETRHAGDLPGQIAETMENLRAVNAAAGFAGSDLAHSDWALKIYLHDPSDQRLVDEMIDAMFGADNQRLILQADICRRDLLVEIEVFRQFGGTPTVR